MRRAFTAIVTATLLTVVVACGADDEQDARDAAASFAAAAKAKDANAACQRLSRESRELLDRVAEMREGERRRCDDIVFRGQEGDPGASLNEFQAKAEDADVEVTGDRAVLREKGSVDLHLRKADGEWTIDAVAMPDFTYNLRASVACGELRREELRQPLPKPTRASLAAATRRQAQGIAGLRARIARLRPPSGDAEAHRSLLRELDAQVKIVRSVAAQTAGVVEVGRAFNRGAQRLARSDRRLTAAQKKLAFVCLGPQAAANASGFRRDAERICASAGRRIARLEEPEGAEAAVAYLRRLEATGRSAMRRLAAVRAPGALADRHRESIAAYRDTLDVLADERRTIRAGRDPADDVERLERSSVRASFGFRQLALPACAAL